MDLNTITDLTLARSRADLATLSPATAPLAGGTWLFSEPQDHLTGLVDLTSLGWPSLTVTPAGDLEIAATCTIAELSTYPDANGWPAHPALYLCCTAFYASFKIWNVATFGGNLCASLPAGPMTSLAAALEGEALIWAADGSEHRMPVTRFITGNKTNALKPGEVLRSVTLPAHALASRVAFRKIALSALGRSGAVLLGRRAPDGSFVLTVTAATVRPVLLRFDTLPDAATLRAGVLAITDWFTDAHGASDWRRAVSATLADEIREELA